MAFVPMADAVSGNIASAAEYNKVVSNVEDHEARVVAAEADVVALEGVTTNVSGAIGIGNQRLSDRLGAGVTNTATADARFGAGVGTGANVTTGSAASQLADIRTRLGAGVTTGSPAATQLGALDTRLDDAETDIAALQAATGGAAPYCKLVQTANQSLTTSGVVVDWTSTLESRGVTVNLTTNTVTILTAGLYSLCSNVSGQNASGSLGSQWLKNGSAMQSGASFQNTSGTAFYKDVQNNIHARLAVNDVISLQGWANPTANTLASGGHEPSMSVLYVAA